jgi:hypothetical protein
VIEILSLFSPPRLGLLEIDFRGFTTVLGDSHKGVLVKWEV